MPLLSNIRVDDDLVMLSGCYVIPSPVPKSPARQNTMSGVGVSPPKGFHSWLVANRLSVVSNTGNTNAAYAPMQGITASLGCAPGTPPSSVSGILAAPLEKTSQTTGKSSDLVPRTIICLDGPNVNNSSKQNSSNNTEMSKSSSPTRAKVSKKGIETTGSVALSKYWADKIKLLKGYLPLTIFNTNWLKQDLLKHQSKPPTSKDKEDRYQGLSVPSEWKMTFGEWVTAFDLFVSYLCYYKHDELAAKFRIHKEIVFYIMIERLCWPMAFRYNLAVHTTVLTFRNADGKLENPAVRNKTIERDTSLDSERLGDFNPRFTDCNYADGQCKANINPINGEVMRFNNN